MPTLRELRHQQGWTQYELALKVGVQPQSVYLWESGRRTPQVAQMRKLGEIFGLCSDEIVLGPTRTTDSDPLPLLSERPPSTASQGTPQTVQPDEQ
jgi:DNA-binding XRE family transcriptional regulator